MDKKMYATEASVLQGIPVPAQTRTYKPISHQQLIELSLEGISKAGFEIEKEIYSMAQAGNQANGRYHLRHGSDPKIGLMIGWQNSYNKSLTLKFAIGAHIFICSNGAISGDIGAFKKKHQGDVQIYTPATISQYIDMAQENYNSILLDKERMLNKAITKRTTAELLGRMFIEEAIITNTQLEIIKKELKAPTHDYEAPGTMWELYNFATFAMKEDHPANWFNRHMDVHKFFTEAI